MTITLDQIRANFKASTPQNTNRPNNYYPFWDAPVDTAVEIRFLPDANEENPLGFLVEKLYHVLTINGEEKKVPCLKMYGEECPICKVSQAYYKSKDEDNGKKYYRKKQHIAQALIIDDPLPPDPDTGETHTGKVRYIALGYQLFNIIKDAFESGDFDDVPWDFENGTNFIIKKTQQGKYASYTVGSKFARRSTALSDDQIAVAKSDMVDLSTLLPAQPGRESVEAMLEAALTGSSYESDDLGEEEAAISNTIANLKAKKTSESAQPAPSKPAAKAVETKVAVSSEEDEEAYEAKASALLASIQQRRKTAAE